MTGGIQRGPACVACRARAKPGEEVRCSHATEEDWERYYALAAEAERRDRYPLLRSDDLSDRDVAEADDAVEGAREALAAAGVDDDDALYDVAAEFHRTGGFPLLTGRPSTADELAAHRYADPGSPTRGVPDSHTPRPVPRFSQPSIVRALHTLRSSVRAPSFIARRCGNYAVDGLPCRHPLKVIPIALTDRNDPGSERWKLAQSLAGAAPFFAWPVSWHVYVASGPLVEPMRRDADRTTARELLRASADEFERAVVVPLERRLRAAGFGGHTVVWASPDAMVAVVLTDAPPSAVLGDDLAPRNARAFFHDGVVEPIADPDDAGRWFREVVDRFMAHHRHVRGEWWDQVVEAMAISAFHNNRPWGYALLERIGEGDRACSRCGHVADDHPEGGACSDPGCPCPGFTTFGEKECPAAGLLHPASPKVAAEAVVIDFYPYAPGPGTFLELLGDHAKEVRERLRRAGKEPPIAVADLQSGPGPPETIRT